MEQQLDLGFGVPTRVVALEPDRGHWENQLQVDLGTGWEAVMTFAPPRAGLDPEKGRAWAFQEAVRAFTKNGGKFFEPWAQRRSVQIANARAKAAEEALKAAQHAKAAPQRAAYVEEALAELGRRSDEKARLEEEKARLRADDKAFEP